MKLILLLAAIYSMIYHQSRKVKELALDVPAKSIQSDQHYWPEKTGYSDGYLLSGFNSGKIETKQPVKRVYQQKSSVDHRYPFYQPALSVMLK